MDRGAPPPPSISNAAVSSSKVSSSSKILLLLIMDITSDQADQLKSLGINISKVPITTSDNITPPLDSTPTIGQKIDELIISTEAKPLLTPPKSPIIPILSISGLTFLSFGGLILFKSKDSVVVAPPPVINNTEPVGVPTQVPKSIQHYLLTSQQFFTQALEAQSSNSGDAVNLLNQSVNLATQAITEFPSDFRAYEQRGRIYVSLVDSQPQILQNAIADLSKASQLNPNSAEITRTLATLYAKKGDAQATLTYLDKTINLEPTKAQNFYDLARLQQQAGQLPQALNTYNRLLTIISDPAQKTAIEAEKSALEQLTAQSKGVMPYAPSTPSPSPPSTEPVLQASLPETGLIIAAPETAPDIKVTNQTDSNSLSGVSTLPANSPSISITNTNLTSASQVYLTITKGGKNQTLQVLSKSTGTFTVGLDSPINEEIQFTWWIVN